MVLGLGIVLLFVFYLVSGATSGFWVCRNGQWIKSGRPDYPQPITVCGQSVQLPKTKNTCVAVGGVWEKQGPEPHESCNRKANDRGNLCRDNGECEGFCQVELSQSELSRARRGQLPLSTKFGRCSVWVVELGCFAFMKQGKIQTLCVD
ncbi:hypothetical protein M1523_03325 [Patescibacteria group bacterium]|nr:hypothetical protein [Patescibacteria group bacterium]MCL5091247.1 hypothetical protein [Patescibacteria group bacterium]